mmetsp:Transcript_7171/g.19646  ORF Transcript_7171/g.19646 Transcript_7171/m.19646 type:complete len:297 (-) Transcript_7171:204-1094(-)
MRVCVHKTHLEDHGHEGLHPESKVLLRYTVWVLSDLLSIHPLSADDARPSECPVHRRDHQCWHLRAESLAHEVHRVCLVHIVEFHPHGAGPVVNHICQVQPGDRPATKKKVCKFGEASENHNVSGDGGLEARALHLESEGATLDANSVHLSETRGCDGFLWQHWRASTKLLSYDSSGVRQWKGRDLVTEHAKLLDDLITQDILPCGKSLPKLDEGRAQLLKLLTSSARIRTGTSWPTTDAIICKASYENRTQPPDNNHPTPRKRAPSTACYSTSILQRRNRAGPSLAFIGVLATRL